MKINYNRLVELNRESLHGVNLDTQMSSYWIIQNGLERYLNGETISNEYVNFLIQIGILELETENQEEKKIVKPFNFTGNDGPQGN
jgi:hypothetical protein